jgi:rubrerythrin
MSWAGQYWTCVNCGNIFTTDGFLAPNQPIPKLCPHCEQSKNVLNYDKINKNTKKSQVTKTGE